MDKISSGQEAVGTTRVNPLELWRRWAVAVLNQWSGNFYRWVQGNCGSGQRVSRRVLGPIVSQPKRITVGMTRGNSARALTVMGGWTDEAVVKEFLSRKVLFKETIMSGLVKERVSHHISRWSNTNVFVTRASYLKSPQVSHFLGTSWCNTLPLWVSAWNPCDTLVYVLIYSHKQPWSNMWRST